VSTIERLKELEAKAMHAASRDYQYSGYEQLAELRDLVPLLCDEIHKLLAVVEAADELAKCIAIRRRNGLFEDACDLGQSLIKYDKMRIACDKVAQ
jgi:hypothetical protein